jgi:hypothetical protein
MPVIIMAVAAAARARAGCAASPRARPGRWPPARFATAYRDAAQPDMDDSSRDGWRTAPQRGAGAALGCAAPGRTNAATTRHALGEGLRAVVVFAVYSSTKTAPAMLARSAIVAGKKPKPAAPAAAAGGAVALAPRTHVELQHDVEIVGRWRRPTMFNAE